MKQNFADKLVLRDLISAIQMVRPEYILCDDIFHMEDPLRKQTERSFAYELYHQWSCILWKEIHSRCLQISGEVTKEEYQLNETFPDLVLHGGQNNTHNQLMAVEIKREIATGNQDLIFKDLNKLSLYLSPEDSKIAYKQAALIILNCQNLNNEVGDFGSCIHSLFFKDIKLKKDKKDDYTADEIKKMRSHIQSVSNRINCIGVYLVPSESNLPIVKCLKLSEILKNK